jgi:putative transcriptional regulator
MSEELDNHIAKLRTKRKISQQELAEAIGVSRKTISTVETMRFTPSVIIALKLAKYFEVPVESVFELVPFEERD